MHNSRLNRNKIISHSNIANLKNQTTKKGERSTKSGKGRVNKEYHRVELVNHVRGDLMFRPTSFDGCKHPSNYLNLAQISDSSITSQERGKGVNE